MTPASRASRPTTALAGIKVVDLTQFEALLGEHTEEVLSEWLGMTGSEIDEYKKNIVTALPEVALR
jgi:hypothetical protein